LAANLLAHASSLLAS